MSLAEAHARREVGHAVVGGGIGCNPALNFLQGQTEHFKDGIIQAFYDGIRDKPQTTFGNVEADVIAGKEPHFHRGNFCSVIRCSAWHSRMQLPQTAKPSLRGLFLIYLPAKKKGPLKFKGPFKLVARARFELATFGL